MATFPHGAGQTPDSTIVVDGSVLAAYLDETSDAHELCAGFLRDHPGPFVVPYLSAARVAETLASRLGPSAESRVVHALSNGIHLAEEPGFVPVSPSPEDLLRIEELMVEYEHLPLGFVRAAVVAVAERVDVRTLATLDLEYARVRPAHADALVIVP